MKKIFLIILFIYSGNLFSQPTIPEPERIRTYDVQHIKINVGFNWDKKEVEGNVETKITPLRNNFREFEVDAVGFNINYIKDKKNKDLKFKYDGRMIKINLNRDYSPSDTITYWVSYTCKPQRGLYFIYPTELNPSMPYQIWTQGEDNDNRYWIPVYDYPNDKTTFEMYVTVDDKFKTLSNGYLDYSKKIPDTGKRQDHWIMDKPNSTYLIMLAVGDFNIIEYKFNDLPVQSYTDKNISTGDAAYTFRNTPQMIKVFSEKYKNEYPWNKYSQVIVEDFIFGGMENTSATVLIKRLIYNNRTEQDYSGDGTISHELAHQWWGDLVTCRNWNEMWLNESFAEFSAALWKENYYGRDEYDYEIYRSGENAFRSDSVTGRYPIWAGYGSVTTAIYDKGSVILNTFRHILGDTIFFKSLGNYLKENEYKNVVSSDLIDAINKTYKSETGTDNDFKWMFDQWIFKAGYPKLDVNYSYDDVAGSVILNVRQMQTTDTLTPVFRMPVDVRLKNSLEDKVERVEISKAEETFTIPMQGFPDMIVFDYGNNILDKDFFHKTFEEWDAQYSESENAIDRIMALKNIERFLKEDTTHTAGKPVITINQIETLRLLQNALNNDIFWGTRAEAAKILAKNFIIDRSGSILRDAYGKQIDTKVQREILKALGNSKRSEDWDFVKEQIQNQPDDYILADGLSALGNSLPAEEIYDVVSPYKNKISDRDVVQYAVISAITKSDTAGADTRVKKVLMDIAFGTDIEGRLRSFAISALRKYAKDDDVKALAIKYVDNNFIVVKRGFIILLSYSNDKSIIPFFKKMNEGTTDEELSKLLISSIKRLEDSK